MRIGLLTGGGDCPGLNAAIRAVVKQGLGEYGHTIIGFRNGWKGVVDGDVRTMSREDIRNVLPQGGTLLGTARYHPHSADGGLDGVMATLEAERIEALICIGGDGTLHAANKVAEQGIKIVAIPKTIDNDVAGTDLSIGFHTAVNIATEAIDRIHTTAESHNRVMVVEVMGRHAGWIAVNAGIAGGAEARARPRRALRHGPHRQVPQAPSPLARELLDRRGRRGRAAQGGQLDAVRGTAGQVRRDRRRRHR